MSRSVGANDVTILPQSLLISLDDWERRKSFVGFGPADEAILSEVHLVAVTYADQVMDELYGR